jgi:hypothetical protein
MSALRFRDYSLATLLLTAAADWLFFNSLGQSVGLSAPLFMAMMALGIVVTHRRQLPRQLAPSALFLMLGLLALIETVDTRSAILSTLCLAGFALAASRRLPNGTAALPVLARFLATVPLTAFLAGRQRHRAARRAKQRGLVGPLLEGSWLVWAMPLALASGFTLLLGLGNPVLGSWFALIDPFLLLDLFDPIRILFWIAAVILVWPFLRPRIRNAKIRLAASPPTPAFVSATFSPAWPSLVYGSAAVLRALLLFNAVFAVQTLLDGVYLWGGMALPEGISYASYAHRGAYTLIVTALLAAVFVLLALRPGASAAADPRIRALVYLWIAQNVVLVLSSMLRLDLYVDVYALTHWRLAAFVWMGIVAAGLILLCVQIAWRKSDRWLVGANLAVLGLVFTASCFVDDNALIARFNVEHSREITGEGVNLDVEHLTSLGPAAVPAIDLFLGSVRPDKDKARLEVKRRELEHLRLWLATRHRRSLRDWRWLTFRKWRLSRYLGANPVPAPLAPSEPALPSLAGPN